jgi:hypothetical protein
MVSKAPFPYWETLLDFADCKKNWDCEDCHGSGRVTYDDPDCVEGHKFSKYYDCLYCGGSGKISQFDLNKRWLAYKRKSRNDMKKHKEQEKLVNSILKKLNPKELKAIYDLLL